MPRTATPPLTWLKSQKLWSKWYKGKRYYLSPRGTLKSDKEALDAALAKWQTIKATLDLSEPGTAPTWLTRIIDRPPVDGEGFAIEDAAMAAAKFASDYSGLDSLPGTSTSKTVETNLSKLIQIYLQGKREAANAQQISVGMYREHKDKLEDFEGFAKKFEREEIHEIDGRFLEAYKVENLRRIPLDKEHGGISAVTARKRLQIVKRFIDWAFEQEALKTLPRNLNRKFCKVKLPTPSPKAFTLPEIRALWGKANQRVKLYIALGLNCGYNPTDIATLTAAMVDWKTRVITRKRHKTGAASVHKLWKVTADLLKFEKTTDKTSGPNSPLLLSNRGKPLVRDTVSTEKGTTCKTDLIGREFGRVKEQLKKIGDNRGFKVLRKTSADLLAAKYPPHVADLFLAHAPKNAVKKHYTHSADLTALFEGLAYLEKHYGLKV